jgi:hemerythrin superfamily protein
VDAIQVIKQDHRDVERLFAAFERAHRGGDRHEQRRIARDLVRALSIHAAIEEQVVYPALREGAGERVLDALEEHHAVKLTLAELEKASLAGERFAAKVRVLEQHVREHVAEEERELLPRLRDLGAARLRELGDALAKAKRSAPTRPHPAAPDTPPGNVIAGTVVAIYDRGRDALRGVTETLRSAVMGRASRGARAARDAAAQARLGGERAVREARQRGREVVDEVADRGLRLVDAAERRSRAAAREVRARAREAAREVRGGSPGRPAPRRRRAKRRSSR